MVSASHHGDRRGLEASPLFMTLALKPVVMYGCAPVAGPNGEPLPTDDGNDGGRMIKSSSGVGRPSPDAGGSEDKALVPTPKATILHK
jgi:hypothetical protein